MTDPHEFQDVQPGEDRILLHFRDYRYDGPRLETIVLDVRDAYLLLDTLAEELGQIAVAQGSIVFEPEWDEPHLRLVEPVPVCDGYCDDCDYSCPHRKKNRRRTFWSHGPSYIAPMKLDLGHNHPHQQEGS